MSPYSDEAEMESALRRQTTGANPYALVLWPGENPAAVLDVLARANLNAATITLPSNALEPAKDVLVGNAGVRAHIYSPL